MRIGLMGFEFKSANKGCEALVYSFLSIIKDINCENIIVYNFSGTDLGEVPNFFKEIQFVNVLPKLKDFRLRYIRSLSKCDVIFDVTMGDSFSDIYSKDYYDYLIRNKRIATMVNNKYILLPQTYGPFEYEDSNLKAGRVFNKSYRIYCRDEVSQKLLEDRFGIYNSILTSDMAFILPYEKDIFQFTDNPKIGINISGLLYKGGFNKENQFGLSLDYPELVDNLISSLSNKYEVHLISHVIDENLDAYDDDYKICKLVQEKYPNTILAPAFETPIQAKSYISNMDVFVGSRMHSTIASFSTGVVTIPISYSRKFEGLFYSLNYPYVINAKEESTKSAFDYIMKYICDKEILAQCQKESMNLIGQKIEEFKKSIFDIMEDLK